MTCPCGVETIQAKDGLCRECRCSRLAMSKRKYVWTPEMDAQLVRAYRVASNKTDLTRRLRELMRSFQFPRHILQNRAGALGLHSRPQILWTDDEIEMLREWSGTLSLTQMARKLRRTESAVKNKLFTLDLGCAVLEGFSQNELAHLFGVHHNKVGRWVARGWLFVNDQNLIPHASVEAFIWKHMDEYRFAACEEWWLKTMLNPKIGSKPVVSVSREVAA
jgi:hypothetical protein